MSLPYRNPKRGTIAITKEELDQYLNDPANSHIRRMYDSIQVPALASKDVHTQESKDVRINPLEALVRAHFEQNYTTLTCLGITYEVFGERPGGFTVFGVDDSFGSRFILAHEISFDEVVHLLAQVIYEDALKQLGKGRP
jgi:hypothetical protein